MGITAAIAAKRYDTLYTMPFHSGVAGATMALNKLYRETASQRCIDGTPSRLARKRAYLCIGQRQLMDRQRDDLVQCTQEHLFLSQ